MRFRASQTGNRDNNRGADAVAGRPLGDRQGQTLVAAHVSPQRICPQGLPNEPSQTPNKEAARGTMCRENLYGKCVPFSARELGGISPLLPPENHERVARQH